MSDPESMDQRTIVGIPFYDGEGADVLDACLRNVDNCLNNLNIDAKILVGINGPRVSMGSPPLAYGVDQSKFNADIEFIKTPPGLVAAERRICRYAIESGLGKIFLTDADISRFPLALHNMWHSGKKPLIGANYATYPPEIMEQLDLGLTPEEIMLMKIFEADKHPAAREFTTKPKYRRRLKGSLLLVDPQIGLVMFGNQGITSDSRMNKLIDDQDKQIVEEAVFMHYPRIDLTDYVQARMRHMRAAHSEGHLDAHSKQEVKYSETEADQIATQIKNSRLKGEYVASNFLLQTALRHEVVRSCRRVINGQSLNPPYPYRQPLNALVETFSQARECVGTLLHETVNWDTLSSPVANGKGVTQTNLPRAPLDLQPLLTQEATRSLLMNYVGLPTATQV